MKKKFLLLAKNWLLRALQLQFFITLISLPMLICWGLPISLLTVLGNLLFNPLITLFLFLSSLTFFTELLHIPNGIFVTALEYTGKLWLKLIAVDAHPWLMGFSQPSWLLILTLPIAALLILHYKKITHVGYKTCLFLGTLVLFCTYLTFMARTTAPAYQELPCNRGHVTLVCEQNQLVLIDPGVIGQRVSAPSWIEYTLTAHLLRTMGKTSIEHVIALQPSGLLFEALETLMTKAKIGTLYIASWEGDLDWNMFSRFEKFQHAARMHNIPIVWLSKLPVALTLSPHSTLTISPQNKTFVHAKLHLPVFTITGHADTQQFVIYPYAYKKKLALHEPRS